jgi:hypothetical protein
MFRIDLVEMMNGYSKSLPPLERDALDESIAILAAFVVGIDRQFDDREMEATVECLAEAETTLGEEFRSSPAARAAFDRLSKNARDKGLEFFQDKLTVLAAIVHQMPPEMAREYRSFIGRMSVKLASASGRVLWFGEAINQDERQALQIIGKALGITFPSTP